MKAFVSTLVSTAMPLDLSQSSERMVFGIQRATDFVKRVNVDTSVEDIGEFVLPSIHCIYFTAVSGAALQCSSTPLCDCLSIEATLSAHLSAADGTSYGIACSLKISPFSSALAAIPIIQCSFTPGTAL